MISCSPWDGWKFFIADNFFRGYVSKCQHHMRFLIFSKGESKYGLHTKYVKYGWYKPVNSF